MQGLGRRVQPGAAFKQSRCLCAQTASLNTERGREPPANRLRAPRAPLPPRATSARHGQHPPQGCPASRFGATRPICSPIPTGTHPASGCWSAASPARAVRRLELASLGLIRLFSHCSCSSQLLPTPKQGRSWQPEPSLPLSC